MRRAVQQDASVQLVTILRTSTNKFYRQGVDTPDELEEGFPSDPEDLFAYEALILGSFEVAFFTPKQQVAIRDFVSRRGGTLMMLAGPSGLGAGGWQHSELVDALPAALDSSEDSFVREKVSVGLSTQGIDSLICRLDPDPVRNAELWREMPQVGGLPAARRAQARGHHSPQRSIRARHPAAARPAELRTRAQRGSLPPG